jgi:hypothetical protein
MFRNSGGVHQSSFYCKLSEIITSGFTRKRHCKSPYVSADSYGRYLAKVSDGAELAAAASSYM